MPLTCRAAGGAIESGQYDVGTLSTNIEASSHTYFFFTLPDDTVIIRSASSDPLYPGYTPRRTIFFPSNFVSNPDYGVYAVTESAADFVITNISKPGWWMMNCTLPTALGNISNSYTYSISMLRLVDYPLSYQDLDVGYIHNGQSLGGTIHASADLDAAFFEITNRCTVQIRMGQKAYPLVPNIQLYDPFGRAISADLPPEYRAEITATLTNPGIYTVVCSEKFIGKGQYNVSMVRIPGELSSEDPDVGLVVNGGKVKGTINEPGDLDLAYFDVLADDTIRVSMREFSDADAALNPRIELYDPNGNFIAAGADPFQYEAVITNTCAETGRYYVICKDSEDRKGVNYLFSFDVISGPSLHSKPIPPVDVSASQGLYTDRIVVSWSVVSNATGYDVFRSLGTNEPLAMTTNMLNTSYTDTDVVSNRLYTYQIKARNSFGASDFSESAAGFCKSELVSAVRRAITIGIDNYSPDYSVTPLRKCVADARAIRETMLLGDPLKRWNDGAVRLFADSDASKAMVRETMTLLALTATNGNIVMYSQSSHGGQASGKDTFLCMYDANYSDAELAADLARFREDVTVIVMVDACHSGGLFKGAGQYWPFAQRVMEEYHAIMSARYRRAGMAVPRDLGRNIAFVTASDYNEYSYEDIEHGRYTGFLLKACALSSVDTNKDGEYQFMELHSFAAKKLLEEEPVQHAQSYNDELLSATVARARGAGGGGDAPVTNRFALPECDYDGDRQSDLAVYEPASGLWYIYSFRSGALAWALPWGGPNMLPISGDFDGDGSADLAVYDLLRGYWYIRSLATGRALAFGEHWGGRNMMPVAGDYNGDAITDLAVYDLASGFWYIKTISNVPILWGMSYWGTGFIAVPGDYDGDGIADLAHYHYSSGAWIINKIGGELIMAGLQWGGPGFIPVSGDFDGDGIHDIAVYAPDTGYWYIRSVSGQIIVWQAQWGGPAFAPVSGDFDGDGTADLAVYNGYTGEWFVWSVVELYPVLWQTQWGAQGLLPVKPAW